MIFHNIKFKNVSLPLGVTLPLVKNMEYFVIVVRFDVKGKIMVDLLMIGLVLDVM